MILSFVKIMIIKNKVSWCIIENDHNFDKTEDHTTVFLKWTDFRAQNSMYHIILLYIKIWRRSAKMSLNVHISKICVVGVVSEGRWNLGKPGVLAAIQAKPFTYKCPSITFPFPTRFLDLLMALVLCYFSQSLSLSSLSDFQFWCFSVGICKYKPGYKSLILCSEKKILWVGSHDFSQA